MAIIDEIPKQSPSLPLQARLALRDSFYLQPQDDASTTVNNANHVGSEEDTGDPVMSTSETLLGRYRGIIKDAISLLPRDPGFPNPSTSPVSDTTNTTTTNLQQAPGADAGPTEKSEYRAAKDKSSESSRPQRKRNISHLEPESSRPQLHVPTHRKHASDSDSIIHPRLAKGPGSRPGAGDLPQNPTTSANRQEEMPQADFLAQLGFLEGYSGIGNIQIEDEPYHHIDMSAFDVDIPDFLGNWDINEPKDASLEDDHQLMPTFYPNRDLAEGGSDNFDITMA